MPSTSQPAPRYEHRTTASTLLLQAVAASVIIATALMYEDTAWAHHASVTKAA
jgi:hypothetical protein